MDNDVEVILQRFNDAKKHRHNWDWHWSEIARRIWPADDDFITKRFPGEKRNQSIYDMSGAIALERFAAVMESLMTSRTQVWSKLRAGDEELDKRTEVRAWLEEVNRILFRMRSAPHANFYSQMHEGYKQLGAYGNACIYVDDEPGKGVRYRQCFVGDTYIGLNAQGIIDTIYYVYKLDARQMIDQWGEKAKAGEAKMPATVKRDLEANQPFTKREYLHVVHPRRAFDMSRKNPTELPWASYHVSLEDRAIIRESGYHELPYLFSRYTVNSTEDYGRGPAMLALPAISMLQEMQKTFISSAHLAAQPPLLVPKAGIVGHGSKGVGLRPGYMNYGGLDMNGREMIKPLITGANLSITEAMIERERGVVDDIFLVRLFQILTEGPQMTATEVLIRMQEKGQLIAPTVGRQQSELLGPLVARDFAIAQRRGMLPPMPGALAESGEYEISYDSPAQRLSRMEELTGISQTVEMMAPFAQFDPTIMQIFDAEAIARVSQEITGGPAIMLRSREEFAQIREQIAKSAQEREMADRFANAAPAINQLSQAGASIPEAQGVAA